MDFSTGSSGLETVKVVRPLPVGDAALYRFYRNVSVITDECPSANINSPYFSPPELFSLGGEPDIGSQTDFSTPESAFRTNTIVWIAKARAKVDEALRKKGKQFWKKCNTSVF